MTHPESLLADSRWREFAIALILVRLLCVGYVELLPEEAYYWNYSRHLDIGYLDHPPMVAWLIRLGTAVFGESEFGVRAGALLCGALASVFIDAQARHWLRHWIPYAAGILALALFTPVILWNARHEWISFAFQTSRRLAEPPFTCYSASSTR